MGNNSSSSVKKQTKEQKQFKEIIIENIKEKTKESLKHFQETVDEKLKNEEITTVEYINASNTIQRGEQLMDRGTCDFIKDDYIAIIIRLDPEYIKKKNFLLNKTVKDLRLIIRSIIYDANIIINNTPTVPLIKNEEILKNKNIQELILEI